MARHMGDLKAVNEAIQLNKNEQTEFDTQQVLDLVVHAGDVSFHAREQSTVN